MMLNLLRAAAFALLLAANALPQKQPKLRDLKPGFNLFSVEQDIQMGKEYAAQVEREMPMVNDPAINAFIQRIGQRLASAPQAQGFPFSFKVVQEKSINAFALPGGPTFTHTGLIAAADNEAQIAGVLAHEISHVVLRHGTNQASKAQLIALPAMLGSEMLGARGGITGMLSQLGIGLGANSVLLKFSRNAERDADLLGTRIMSHAGYNPIEMARFFEKLEAESGKGNWLTNFMASHPNPGNRVKAVQDEIRLLPPATYQPESGDLPQVKQRIQGLPEVKPKAQPGALQAGGDPRNIQAARPSQRLKELRGQQVVFGYPENWQAVSNQQSGEVTITSSAGVIGQAIGYGLLANMLATRGRPDLTRATQQLIADFQKRDQNLQVVGSSRRFQLNGANAMATRLQGPSAFEGTQEAVVLVTVEGAQGLFYLLLIAPASDLQYAQPVFDQIINSVRVLN